MGKRQGSECGVNFERERIILPVETVWVGTEALPRVLRVVVIGPGGSRRTMDDRSGLSLRGRKPSAAAESLHSTTQWHWLDYTGLLLERSRARRRGQDSRLGVPL